MSLVTNMASTGPGRPLRIGAGGQPGYPETSTGPARVPRDQYRAMPSYRQCTRPDQATATVNALGPGQAKVSVLGPGQATDSVLGPGLVLHHPGYPPLATLPPPWVPTCSPTLHLPPRHPAIDPAVQLCHAHSGDLLCGTCVD